MALHELRIPLGEWWLEELIMRMLGMLPLLSLPERLPRVVVSGGKRATFASLCHVLSLAAAADAAAETALARATLVLCLHLLALDCS